MSLFAVVLSLKQMGRNSIDLKKFEEETKAKISAVNAQKVPIVGELMSQIKVWRTGGWVMIFK